MGMRRRVGCAGAGGRCTGGRLRGVWRRCRGRRCLWHCVNHFLSVWIRDVQCQLHGIAPLPPYRDVRLAVRIARQCIANPLLIACNFAIQCRRDSDSSRQTTKCSNTAARIAGGSWAIAGRGIGGCPCGLPHGWHREQQPPVLQRPLRNRPLLGFEANTCWVTARATFALRQGRLSASRQQLCTPFQAAQKRSNRRGLWGRGGWGGHVKSLAMMHLSVDIP